MKVKSRRDIKVLKTVLEIPLYLHNTRTIKPSKLVSKIIADGGLIKMDMRVHYPSRDKLMPTSRGIRFTLSDLKELNTAPYDLFSSNGSEGKTFSDFLKLVLIGQGKVKYFQNLEDGHTLGVTYREHESERMKKQLEFGGFVDFRRYRKGTIPTSRGFRLGYKDISNLEKQSGLFPNRQDLITRSISIIENIGK